MPTFDILKAVLQVGPKGSKWDGQYLIPNMVGFKILNLK